MYPVRERIDPDDYTEMALRRAIAHAISIEDNDLAYEHSLALTEYLTYYKDRT